jgi:hypothetical protein
VLNRVVFGFFFGSYCLIAIVLNQVTKKINRAQPGSIRVERPVEFYLSLAIITPVNTYIFVFLFLCIFLSFV